MKKYYKYFIILRPNGDNIWTCSEPPHRVNPYSADRVLYEGDAVCPGWDDLDSWQKENVVEEHSSQEECFKRLYELQDAWSQIHER